MAKAKAAKPKEKKAVDKASWKKTRFMKMAQSASTHASRTAPED